MHIYNWRHTVGNGPVVSRFIEAICGEGVGNASELRLDQSIGYRIVETLEESIRSVSRVLDEGRVEKY